MAFQDRASNPARDVVLGFVVAGTTADATCTPTWGTYETLDGAASTMDLDRRVAQTRGQGGDAIISFGGQANTELAIACDDAGKLGSAYKSVVERYTADTIDFDIEGEALHDTAANARRATAVKALQDEIRADGGRLAVWLTLPVTPDGLNPDALAVVRTMIDAKVDVAGVNVMAMDFGVPSAGKDMLGAVESSLTSTHAQLGALFGTDKSSSQLWGKLGATVMIGQNDVDGESLSVADARAIKSFASSRGIARVSTWSLNRDTQCGATFPVIGTHSNLCSGVAQKPLEFTKTFAKLRGTARAKSAIVTSPTALPAVTSETKDDPAKEPLPDLAAAAAVQRRLQGRLAPGRLHREVVHAGRLPGRAERRGGRQPLAARGAGAQHRPRADDPDAPRGNPSEVARRHGLPLRRQGAPPGPPVPGELVHAGRRPGRDRPERHSVAVEGALPHPGGADRRLIRVSGCG